MYARMSNVDARKINERLSQALAEGSAASGQVLTLVVVTDTVNAPMVTANAMAAGRLHPSRVVLVIRDKQSQVDDDHTGIDVEIRSGESIPGDMITLWLSGEVEQHPASIVVPLLLPQLPIVVWLPGTDRELLAGLDHLTSRLIIDTSHTENGNEQVDLVVQEHEHGLTDISWTRLTRWRSLLVSLLDQAQTAPTKAVLSAPSGYAPAQYLSAWLQYKTGIEVERQDTAGKGISSVVLESEAGQMQVRREAGTHGIMSYPGQPERPVALAWRTPEELIGEELLQLNGDEMFDALIGYMRSKVLDATDSPLS